MDLRDIIRIIKKRKLILISIPVIAVLTSAIVSFFVLTPVYKASTTMMVGKSYTGENAALVQYQDLLTANQLVKTYSEIARSRTVAEKVITKAGLDTTPEQFSGKVKVNPVKDTQLIEVAVEDKDPQKAAEMANLTSKVFMVKVVEVMNVDNVQVVDSAVTPNDPIKPNKKLNIAIAGVLGFMIAIGLIFLLEFIDKTIKNSEDVNRHLELPVLGSIPKME
ncbi:MAG: lipopolysaccharide biosynthesis protein [Firmicutes bacterium]|nr:lipopolysaccharide biosynthesis protein [Bacillota bacterium]